jgi:hypothetical protein
MRMRHLLKHRIAQVGMVGAAIGLLITLLISVLIYFSIAPAAQPTAAQMNRSGTVAQRKVWNQSNNASNAISNQAATFFTIAPIVAIVIVAVVVIGYVQRIGG